MCNVGIIISIFQIRLLGPERLGDFPKTTSPNREKRNFNTGPFDAYDPLFLLCHGSACVVNRSLVPHVLFFPESSWRFLNQAAEPPWLGRSRSDTRHQMRAVHPTKKSRQQVWRQAITQFQQQEIHIVFVKKPSSDGEMWVLFTRKFTE